MLRRGLKGEERRFVPGDYALMSLGSFMQAKYLCVLIHIGIKGEVGAP